MCSEAITQGSETSEPSREGEVEAKWKVHWFLSTMCKFPERVRVDPEVWKRRTPKPTEAMDSISSSSSGYVHIVSGR